jgi:uncharacterized membrane protein
VEVEQIARWIAIGGSLLASLSTVGMIFLYKWKVDRLWAEFARKHGLNGHEEEE